jgi:hypothetical protein
MFISHFLIKFKRWLRKNVDKAHITLRVKAKVQLKSSNPIDAKVEISPKGFTLRARLE